MRNLTKKAGALSAREIKMSEGIDDDWTDDEGDEPPTLSLEESVAWVATRNTEFVQLVSATLHSDSFDDPDPDRIAAKSGIEMSFAASATKAWEMLRSAIASGRVRANGISIEVPADHTPGTALPLRGPRVDLPGRIANDLELVGGYRMSLRPRELGPPQKWWFRVEVDLEQIKTTFPTQNSSIRKSKTKKGKKGAPLQDYAEKVLRDLYPDGPPPVGITLSVLTAKVEKTGGPERRKDFHISSKTVGRAAKEIWPGWPDNS
jgi:hypothetical protein